MTGVGSISNLTSATLFDTRAYPIHERDQPAYGALLRRTRDSLAAKNCAQLSDFLRAETLEAIQAEALQHRPKAVFHQADLNPYFSEPPTNKPADHPLRRLAPRRHGMIRADFFDRAGVTWALFQNADLCQFVADSLGFSRLYPYPDPFGSVNVNVQPPGREFSWHFDTNDYTVSIGLTQSAEGGVFEYVPDIRTDKSENYDEVKAVLDGDRQKVHSLVLKPGDLQLFRGGYSLHRVTAPVDQERHSLLLSYVEDPDYVTTPEAAQRMWGEAHPLHHQRASRTNAKGTH
ncbi:MAG: hypothetical protein AAF530_03075 [Pseudomonadota bacterium]